VRQHDEVARWHPIARDVIARRAGIMSAEQR
jgi:hypothetical protein